jgi:16S rRNA (uracil1498-N3)-methyltransferase
VSAPSGAPDREGGPHPGRDPDGGGGPHVFVDDLDRPELADQDRHHLERVLRLRPGDPLTVSDGRGRWRAVRLGAALEPAGEVIEVPAPEPALTVAFAPVKGERPEWVVQKLTELGIDEIRPFLAARSVVRWEGERAESQATRLRRVAREAAGQCRRSRLPVVHPVVLFTEIVSLDGAALAVPGGAPPSLARPTIAVGPEGGWDDAERAAGLPDVALGRHVLRAETAAVTAGGLLAALREGLVGPV